jgi:monothiol glutaredoxin
MARDVQNEIKTLVTENPVVLYMKGTPTFPMCGFSAAAVQVLEDIGVSFKSVNVLEDQDVREGVKKFSDWPTIPQLYVGGEFIGGSDIMRDMHTKGELAPLIAKATKGGA